MKIDIRDELQDEKVTEIQFADPVDLDDDENDYIGYFLNSQEEGIAEFDIRSNDEVVHIKIKDIDNLIKALKKAKELWT